MSTPLAIAALTLTLSPDVADVCRCDAPLLAAGLRREGFTGIGADYDIGSFFGDREAVETLLGRPLTREEATALEACIRHYLDASDAA